MKNLKIIPKIQIIKGMVSYIFPSMETEFPLGKVFCRWIMLAAHVYWGNSEGADTHWTLTTLSSSD